MDFHTLARKDLQALCKKNKIPANITNVAMADALKALKLVEGIDEFMQQSQSGTAQSSIDSLETPEVTSPFVPQTAGRSTRHTNIPKPTAESVNPTIRTRRTARKTQIKDADAIETPAMVQKTNRKNGTMASARLNMDSLLKECADEDKKDFLNTPVVVTSRRKKAKESMVARAYSTRRSVRLAEKSGVEILNEVAKDGENEEMNLKDGVDNFNELSGFADGDAITTVEENSENKHEFEDVSISKDEFEVESNQKQDTSIGNDIDAEEEKCSNFETVSEEIKMESHVEKGICNNEEDMLMNDSNEVQQNDRSEIEITVDKSSEELKFEEGETSQDEAAIAEFVENVILDSGDNFVVDEFYFDNIGSHDETKEELNNDIVDGGLNDVIDLNGTLDKLTELTLPKALTQETGSDFVDHLDIPEQQLNENDPRESEKVAADPVPLETEPIEIDTLEIEESEKADEPYADADVIEVTLPSGFEGLENEPTEIEILKPEEGEKAADVYADIVVIEMTLPSGFEGLGNEPTEIEILKPEEGEKAAADEPYADIDVIGRTFPIVFEGLENEPTEIEILKPEGEKAADEPYADIDVIEMTLPKGFEGLENEPTEIEILKPEEDEKAAEPFAEICEWIPTMKNEVCISDNKENIGSGCKMVFRRDLKQTNKIVKNVDSLDDLSVRQLTKMLKEKLEITKKSSNIENGNEAVMSRTALQVVDGAGN